MEQATTPSTTPSTTTRWSGWYCNGCGRTDPPEPGQWWDRVKMGPEKDKIWFCHSCLRRANYEARRECRSLWDQDWNYYWDQRDGAFRGELAFFLRQRRQKDEAFNLRKEAFDLQKKADWLLHKAKLLDPQMPAP